MSSMYVYFTPSTMPSEATFPQKPSGSLFFLPQGFLLWKSANPKFSYVNAPAAALAASALVPAELVRLARKNELSSWKETAPDSSWSK